MNVRRALGGAVATAAALLLVAAPASATEVEPAPTPEPSTSPSTPVDGAVEGLPEAFQPLPPELIDAVVEANSRLALLDAAVAQAVIAVRDASEAADDAQEELAAADRSLARADDRVQRTTRQIAAIEDLLRLAAVGEYTSDGAEEEWFGQYLTGRTDDGVLRRALTRYVDRTTEQLIADLQRQKRSLRRQRDTVADRRDDVAALRDALDDARDRRREEAAELTALRADVQEAAEEAQTALEAALVARQELIEQMIESGISLVEGEGLSLDGVPLCDVRGIVVACPIATPVAEMVAAAAVDGVTLTGSGWRSTQRQVELRAANCGGDVYGRSASACSPPTARPGSSQHELGLAIDFHGCASRTTACYQWLAANASRFGFENLESEPWHWSTTGS